MFFNHGVNSQWALTAGVSEIARAEGGVRKVWGLESECGPWCGMQHGGGSGLPRLEDIHVEGTCHEW